MKTPMTFEEWWAGGYGYVNATPKNESMAADAWHAALANSPQPQWRKWSESKPQVENEFGSCQVVLRFHQGQEWGELWDVKSVEGTDWNVEPFAFLYILPIGFAPKQKDEASIAFQEWVNKKCEGVTMIPDPTVKESRVGNVTEDVFTEIYNLGRAKAKLI